MVHLLTSTKQFVKLGFKACLNLVGQIGVNICNKWIMGRTSSAPNSALRLIVDKDQGLWSGLLS